MAELLCWSPQIELAEDQDVGEIYWLRNLFKLYMSSIDAIGKML